MADTIAALVSWLLGTEKQCVFAMSLIVAICFIAATTFVKAPIPW
jgi:hypothetical protein